MGNIMYANRATHLVTITMLVAQTFLNQRTTVHHVTSLAASGKKNQCPSTEHTWYLKLYTTNAVALLAGKA